MPVSFEGQKVTSTADVRAAAKKVSQPTTYTPPAMTTATRTYDPTKQYMVDVSQANVVTNRESYNPLTQQWVAQNNPIYPTPNITGGGNNIVAGAGGGTTVTGDDDDTSTSSTTLTNQPVVLPELPPPLALPDTAAFDASTLEAILASIEARYGLSKDQLLADESEVGRLYRFLQSNLAQQQAGAIASSQDEAVQRGILRSGIQLQREGQIENEFAQQKSFASAENAAKLEAIRRQLANLEAQAVAERQAAAAYVGGGRLDTNRALADQLQLAGNAGVTAPIPAQPQGSQLTPEMLALLQQQNQPQVGAPPIQMPYIS